MAVCTCVSVSGCGDDYYLLLQCRIDPLSVFSTQQFARPQSGASEMSSHSLRSSVLRDWGALECPPAAWPKAGEAARLAAWGDLELSLSCPPFLCLQQSRCSGRSRGCGRRCHWPSWASSPRRPRAWPGPGAGLRAGANTCPRMDRQTGRQNSEATPEPEVEQTDKWLSYGGSTEPVPNVHPGTDRTSRGDPSLFPSGTTATRRLSRKYQRPRSLDPCSGAQHL